jgi:Uma2 family endonuclease
MTVATDSLRQTGGQRRMSLQEFLTYDDGTDRRYELVDGVLIEMGAESTINTWIAGFLFGVFIQMGLPSYRIGFKQKLSVCSSSVTARDPDLIIHTKDSASAIEGRREACLFLGEPNPLIVVEVVSPGDETKPNYQRDYEEKPIEYANRGIPEMWQIDPSREWVRVGTLNAGDYQFQTFMGEKTIFSPSLPELNLTANQILSAGRC